MIIVPKIDILAQPYKFIIPQLNYTRKSPAFCTNRDCMLENVPVDTFRNDFDPITGEYLGILFESQAENLIPANYNKLSVVKDSEHLAPDNTYNNIIKKTEDRISKKIDLCTLNNRLTETFTFSVYIKPIGTTVANIILCDKFTIVCDFNKTECTNNDGIQITFIKCKTGWYRLTVTITPSTPLIFKAHANYHQGVLYFWGLQLEMGSYASSYTLSERGADTASIDISKVISNSQGTIILDVTPKSENICLSSNQIIFRRNNDTILASILGVECKSTIITARLKFALSYNLGQIKFIVNGGSITSYDSKIKDITILEPLIFNDFNGYFNQFMYYSSALSDNLLRRLTMEI